MSEELLWNQKPSAFILWPRFLFYPILAFSWMLLPDYIIQFEFYKGIMFYQIAGILSSLIIFPLAIAILALVCTRYELTTERLIIHSGILSRNREVIELYRIKDFNVRVPFHLRILFLSNIILFTSDKTAPILKLSGIKNGYEIEDRIRGQVELIRRKTGTREFD